MQSELLNCPFCAAELTVPTAVQYPKLGLARMHPGSLDDGSCPIAGWGFYDEQLAAWNARASDAEITRLTEALRLQMEAKHKEAAEAKLWFRKAQEWKEALRAAEEREKALREAEVKAARLLERLRDFDGWTGTFHAGHAYDSRQEAISYLNSRQALAGAKPC